MISRDEMWNTLQVSGTGDIHLPKNVGALGYIPQVNFHQRAALSILQKFGSRLPYSPRNQPFHIRSAPFVKSRQYRVRLQSDTCIDQSKPTIRLQDRNDGSCDVAPACPIGRETVSKTA